MTVYLYYLGVCVLGEGGGGSGFLVISTAECVVETFTMSSPKAYSLYDNDILFV